MTKNKNDFVSQHNKTKDGDEVEITLPNGKKVKIKCKGKVKKDEK